MGALAVSEGHLFVARADLTRIDCDAWLVPTDRTLRLERPWSAVVDARRAEVPTGWGHDGRVARVRGDPSEPEAWLADVGAVASHEPEWHLQAVRAFLVAAADGVRGRKPRHGRARHLLALPVVGTGAGGARRISGQMVAALIDELAAGAARLEVDVLLAAWEAPAFAAAQAERRRRVGTTLDEGLGAQAARLGALARSGRLVLFLGAGIGRGAGLPLWEALLRELAELAGLGDRLEERGTLDPLDRAAIIATRLRREGRSLGEEIVKRVRSRRFSLGHTLLAALPVREAVTTNYDTLYEEAARAVGRPIAVLPYEAATENGDWLLKLHGSADQPDDIVLTRSDYLRFPQRRAALAGIVQALLITRHMLFVGFSLSDPNFHRIAQDVREAVGDRGGQPFGSSLLLTEDPLLAELWTGDVEMVPMAAAASPAEAARTLEIFLDRLLLEASSGREHLLDERFLGALDDEERIVRAALTEMEGSVPPAVRGSRAWEPVGELLRRLGGRAD